MTEYRICERLRRGVTWSDGRPIEAVVGAVNDPVMDEAAALIEEIAKLVSESLYHLRLDDAARNYHNRVLAALAKLSGSGEG